MASQRIHIIAKDLVAAYGYTTDHSQKLLRRTKKDLCLKATAKLTIKQYCEYVDIDLDEFLTAINVQLPNTSKK